MLDPRVWRTLQDPGEPPPTAPDIRRNIERKHAHWEIHGFGQWLLRDRSDGLAVGRGGLQYTQVTGARRSRSAGRCYPPGGVGGLPPSSR